MLATLAGALLLALALAAAALLTAEAFVRFVSGRALIGPEAIEIVTVYGGLAFAAASLPALPAALAASFLRTGDPPRRSRSALALVPGLVFAVAVWIAALAATIAGTPSFEIGLQIALQRSGAAFAGFVFPLLPLAIALAAALTGARAPESASAGAAPVVLVGVCGIVGDLSIAGVSLAVLFALLAAGAVFAGLYAAAPARSVTPWLVGIALAIGTTLFAATGLLTPTETMALFALFGLPLALLLRTLLLRQALGPILRSMAMEIAALAAALAAAMLALTTLLMTGLDPALGGTFASPVLLAAGGTAFFLASYLLTAVPVLALALPFALAALGTVQAEPFAVASVLVLLALAAVVARAGRAAPAGAGLTPIAAAIGAAVFVALAVLTAFAPQIALAPVRAVLQ
jgi:hypothetical protein